MQKRFFISLLVLLLLTACAKPQNGQSQVQPGEPEQRLRITAEVQSEAGEVLTSDVLGGNFSQGLRCYDVADVRIDLNGEPIALEEALRDGSISEEEISCRAREDARNGFCEETWESSHGLTHFTYRYPDIQIRLIHDVYETPDGKQHLISHMCVYPVDRELGAYTDFYDDETGLRLDREDWGISLEIKEVSGAGLSVICVQSGGQQLGQLTFINFALTKDGQFVDRLDDSDHLPELSQPIAMEGNTDFSISFSQVYGQLPKGDYALVLYIRDEYDASRVHPLTENFTDIQLYEIPFSVS